MGEVVIKGVCANRYLAMNRDGRLFGAVSECYCLSVHKTYIIFVNSFAMTVNAVLGSH